MSDQDSLIKHKHKDVRLLKHEYEQRKNEQQEPKHSDTQDTPLTKQQRKRLKKKAYEQRKNERNQKHSVTFEKIEEVLPSGPSPMTDADVDAMNTRKTAKENLQKWEDMCNLVGDFIKERKTVPDMRSSHDIERILGRWLFVQKTRFKARKMHQYHITRLNEVGVKLNNL